MKLLRRGIHVLAACIVAVTIASCSAPADSPAVSEGATPVFEKVLAAGPCGIVDDTAKAQFSIGAGSETVDPVVVGVRECTWSTEDRRVFYVAILPDRMNLDSVMRGYDEPVVLTIAGKRAVQTYSSQRFKDKECLVFVEYGGVHLLNFQYEPAFGEEPSTHAQVCETTKAFAEQVVASL